MMKDMNMEDSKLTMGIMGIDQINDKDIDNRSTSSSGSDSEDSVSDTRGTGSRGSGTGRSSEEDKKQSELMETLTKQETREVFWLRTVVIIALVLAAAGISTAVYYITSSAESDEFVTQYDGAAAKVIDSFDRIISRIGSINTIGVAATIQGLQSQKSYIEGNEWPSRKNTTWPFVSVTHYEQIAASARELSDAMYISFAPIVSDNNRDAWERYSVGEDKAWIADGLKYQQELGHTGFEYNPPPLDEVLMTNYTRKEIHYDLHSDEDLDIHDLHSDEDLDTHNDTTTVTSGPYLPRWQASPVLAKDHVNEDLFMDVNFGYLAKNCIDQGKAIFGRFENGPGGPISDPNQVTAFFATLRSFYEGEVVEYLGAMLVRLFLPVYDTFGLDKKVVGITMSIFLWRNYLRYILPDSTNGITVVLENTCEGYYTYELNGEEALVIGEGDFHETKFDKYERTSIFGANQTIFDGTKDGMPISVDGCAYVIHIYPSQKFSDAYKTNTPIYLTMAVATVFMVVLLTFAFYNVIVERRQKKVLFKAIQSTSIVASLFPKQVRDRLMGGDNPATTTKGSTSHGMIKSFASTGLLLNGPSTGGSTIADLFPACTVMFADISGFTAWSSSRNPDQVFTLLQSIYQAFDACAKRRRVFKVETIGDCYLSVTGLPDPQPEHALIMCRFAWDCQQKLYEVTTELESKLGPDCSDLKMRFGLHSGPVTAGVLRGERARFQLFGDTVNTAARMESTGRPGKIQMSEATAKLLTKSGKEHWTSPREDLVEAKGKGTVKTYWLRRVKNAGSSSTDSRSEQSGSLEKASDHGGLHSTTNKNARLVDWMVEILLDYVKNMMENRNTHNDGAAAVLPSEMMNTTTIGSSSTYLDEIKESVHMVSGLSCTNNKTKESNHTSSSTSTIITEELVNDLRSYVSIIANMYNRNPFHCFDHACHVTMSVAKLLKRITSTNPGEFSLDPNDTSASNTTTLHKDTYGIHSDTVAQFAIVFSAMIHDVDHRGCSNMQLIQEEVGMAQKYRNKSVAEQNSLDLSWMLLLSDQFTRLRTTLFPTTHDLHHFREIIINTVLATDIFDKELNDLRKARWEKAFAKSSTTTTTEADDGNQTDRKATIVIEHIIQASDVAHTMQHWHVYRKWNKLLFQEMYVAYVDGRMGTDPTTFWYKGELAFFDNYVIPLANKLKECGVFGVSSDEYLNYAVGNREEWEQKGESILEEMVEEMADYKNTTIDE